MRRRRRPRRPGRRRRPQRRARPSGRTAIVGRSTHAPAQADAARRRPRRRLPRGRPGARDADQAGPPRRRACDYVAYAARTVTQAVVRDRRARRGNVGAVFERGRDRIVVVRAITEAPTIPRPRRARCGGAGGAPLARHARKRAARRAGEPSRRAPAPSGADGERPRDDGPRLRPRPREATRRARRAGADRARRAAVADRGCRRSSRVMSRSRTSILVLAGWDGQRQAAGRRRLIFAAVMLVAAAGMWKLQVLGRARLRGAARRELHRSRCSRPAARPATSRALAQCLIGMALTGPLFWLPDPPDGAHPDARRARELGLHAHGADPLRRPRRDAPPQQRGVPALLRDRADQLHELDLRRARPGEPRPRLRDDLRELPYRLPLAGELRRGRRRPRAPGGDRDASRSSSSSRCASATRLLAEGYGVLVGYDYANQKSTELPEALCAKLRTNVQQRN